MTCPWPIARGHFVIDDIRRLVASASGSGAASAAPADDFDFLVIFVVVVKDRFAERQIVVVPLGAFRATGAGDKVGGVIVFVAGRTSGPGAGGFGIACLFAFAASPSAPPPSATSARTSAGGVIGLILGAPTRRFRPPPGYREILVFVDQVVIDFGHVIRPSGFVPQPFRHSLAFAPAASSGSPGGCFVVALRPLLRGDGIVEISRLIPAFAAASAIIGATAAAGPFAGPPHGTLFAIATPGIPTPTRMPLGGWACRGESGVVIEVEFVVIEIGPEPGREAGRFGGPLRRALATVAAGRFATRCRRRIPGALIPPSVG